METALSCCIFLMRLLLMLGTAKSLLCIWFSIVVQTLLQMLNRSKFSKFKLDIHSVFHSECATEIKSLIWTCLMFKHRSKREQTKLRTFNDVTIQLLSKWDLYNIFIWTAIKRYERKKERQKRNEKRDKNRMSTRKKVSSIDKNDLLMKTNKMHSRT